MHISLVFFSLIFTFLPLFSQTIAEKKIGVVQATSELSFSEQKELEKLNAFILERQELLEILYAQVQTMHQPAVDALKFKELLEQINAIRDEVYLERSGWIDKMRKKGVLKEGYALWHQPHTSVQQLVYDYGTTSSVYLIPRDIAQYSFSVSSNLPVPSSSWDEMLEQILLQMGIGVNQVNPYLRSLFWIADHTPAIEVITADRTDLEIYGELQKVAFVLSPEPIDLKRTWQFLERFANQSQIVLERIGRTILVVGDIQSIKELLKVYDFVLKNKSQLEYRAIPLFRVDPEEMGKILSSIFEQFEEDGDREKTQSSQRANALNVIALPKVARAVFIIGTRAEILKAEEIVRVVEGQVGEGRDREVFWYDVKHSDPEELAEVLSKIYRLMIENRIGLDVRKIEEEASCQEKAECIDTTIVEPYPQPFYQPNFYQVGGYVINPRPIVPGTQTEKRFNTDRDNFIVDPKSGAIVMVVEGDLLPRLKEVLAKLDVPKKMVQIEVLLFEKRLRRSNSYGLNLLKIGDKASQTHLSSLTWREVVKKDNTSIVNAGILDFFFSRKKSASGIPAFDLSYRFLMSQDDVHINAAPSIVTMNQTTATIAISDEISIKTGVFQVPTSGGVTLEDAFTRAQYGITIQVTPTIHTGDIGAGGEHENYISIESDITFDSISPSEKQQPDVNRRHITNEARIPDGQTVIIGGLRRRNSAGSKEVVPLLGEIPGFGKLFSTHALTEDNTEMFIFITPKIISEPRDDFAYLRYQELCKRPGDLPCFLRCLNEALEHERDRAFQGYLTILFGAPSPRYICTEGEYDGR